MFAVLTEDRLIEERPVLLEQLVLTARDTSGWVSVYDGHDATNGRKLGTFVAGLTVSKPIDFIPPELLRNGLFVAVGDDITEAVVRWSVYPE